MRKTHKKPSKLYSVWVMMKSRCNNPKDKAYHNYGGRGIKICDEWNGSHDFENFSTWASLTGYREGLSIDRIDNDGDYSPENCRWVTREIQNSNKRNNIFITFNGETKCLKHWCKELGLSYGTAMDRYTKGFPAEKILEKRDMRGGRPKEPQKILYEGNYYTFKQLREKLNISKSTLSYRYMRGLSLC